MFKHVSALFFAGLLAIQINSICSDKFDDAKTQLEDLKALLKGSILSADDRLSTMLEDYQDYTNNVDTEGTLLIQSEDAKIMSQLTVLKELGLGYNLGTCLRGTESFLLSLADSIIYYLHNCIVNTTYDAAIVAADSLYLVDVMYNRANELEFQIGLCSTEACIEPILQLIELETVQLPDKVGIEVTRAEDLFDILKVTTQDCHDGNVAEYTENANFMIEFIGGCIDAIISSDDS